MNDEIEIPTKNEVLIKLKRHLEVGNEYLEILAKEGDSCITVPSGANFYVHYMVRTQPVVAGYFDSSMAEESGQLDAYWDTLVEECEIEAYLRHPYVQRGNFPWFDGLSLEENLRKSFTIDQMIEYELKGTALSISEPEIDRAVFDCWGLVAQRVIKEGFYEKKVNLEEKMIAYLEKPKPL